MLSKHGSLSYHRSKCGQTMEVLVITRLRSKCDQTVEIFVTTKLRFLWVNRSLKNRSLSYDFEVYEVLQRQRCRRLRRALFTTEANIFISKLFENSFFYFDGLHMYILHRWRCSCKFTSLMICSRILSNSKELSITV
jgi:hypothetical protein